MVCRRRICKAILQSGSCLVLVSFVLLLASLSRAASVQTPQIVLQEGVLLAKAGTVEYKAVGRDWVPATQGQAVRFNDQIRTREASRVTLRLADMTHLQTGENCLVGILRPPPRTKANFDFKAGFFRLFTRNKGGEVRFQAPSVAAGNRGTEVNLEVDPITGRTVITVDDGEVDVFSVGSSPTNLIISAERQWIFETNRQPLVVERTDLVQWWLFYPAVLDLAELNLSPAEQADLAVSLEAYRKGNLIGALQTYPQGRVPQSEAERVYFASVRLAVGQVTKTEELLGQVGAENRLAKALRRMIAAVNLRTLDESAAAVLASEWLAQSYYEQSRWSVSRNALSRALAAAEQAVKMSPEFGFALERLAELEFSHGHTARALDYLERSLKVSPENPQAHALNGFLLLARNRFAAASNSFERAIELDGSLGNAWLGRGLCLIRQGKAEEGRSDLQTAAALEPNRSMLRSYLGKAFSNANDDERARRELERAIQLDPNDPTPWLYSALLNQQQSRINQGIADLEKSQELNQNRSLFRSRLLLDQDRAVRSANLASLYRDAGMSEVSVREAARAVTHDYANSSAHLFISDSFNELRDPTRFNLRYETVWFSELLLANLLAPVGAGRLSQNISQQEYSKLFESDGRDLASSTLARSDGQLCQLASQFGTFRNTSWSLDLDYQHNDGVRPNNQLDRLEWYTTVKQQITPQDSVLLLAKYQDYKSGDNFQYYDPTNARPDFSFEEEQKPILVAGYQHEWSPGMRTLLLGGRLANEQRFADLQAKQLVLFQSTAGNLITNAGIPLDVSLESDLEIYTAELNQIAQFKGLTLVAGALWQGGRIQSLSTLENPQLFTNGFPTPPTPAAAGSFTEDFNRFKGYGYLTIEPVGRVWFTGGISYDYIKMPDNFRHPPLSSGTETRDLLSPKAAIVWSPISQVSVRGVFTRSLGGVSLDESFRLEPTQLAGFPQAFRTVISESVAGSVSAPEYETYGLALDLKPAPRTYAGLQAVGIRSDIERTIGVFRRFGTNLFAASSTRENLDYEEWTFEASLNHLVGDALALGVGYRFTQAELKTKLPEIPVSMPGAESFERSDLHRVAGYALYNHPSGWFARIDAAYYNQSNFGYSPDQPGDDFLQLDLQGGYRFARRRAQVVLGILNLTDTDYRLNPLTIYSELPRERVFFARLDFQF
jgi:Flp pilus assembly protein TadD